MPGLYLIVHGLLAGAGGDDDSLHAAKPSAMGAMSESLIINPRLCPPFPHGFIAGRR